MLCYCILVREFIKFIVMLRKYSVDFFSEAYQVLVCYVYLRGTCQPVLRCSARVVSGLLFSIEYELLNGIKSGRSDLSLGFDFFYEQTLFLKHVKFYLDGGSFEDSSSSSSSSSSGISDFELL